MIDPEMQGLVIDAGSGMCKCGFSGDDAPRAVFPVEVKRPKNPGIMVGMDAKDCFIGDEAQVKKRMTFRLGYPVRQGYIENWNDMEKVWHHTFYNELRVTPEEHPTLLTETVNNPNNKREKMTSIMFETFNVPALYIAIGEVLSLLCSGRTTGLSIESGHGATRFVPVFEGTAIQHSSLRMEFGGQSVTEYMVKILSKSGYEMTTSAEREIVRDIKEKLGAVALDYEAELSKAENSDLWKHEYELLDGSKMRLNQERIQAPEIMFQPHLIDLEVPGMSEMTFNTIQKCDIDLRRNLYQNIVLSGGNTMFDGIADRLKKDVQEFAPRNARVNIHTPAERKFSAWIGGSILSSLSSFNDKWITKEEYDDKGATIVHRKCF